MTADTTDASNADASNAGDSNAGDSGIDHLFRREGLVSDLDLRVDVAKELSRTIVGDEDIHVGRRELRSRGDFTLQRQSRDRAVGGTYERSIAHTETVMATAAIREQVDSGVDLLASLESESIVGGAYVNTIAGVSLKICAWQDFLAWGGWLEVDAVRLEIAAASIRAHMLYAHAALARVTVAKKLVDDWVLRTETFGTLVDNTATKMQLSSPGSGMTMEN